MFETTSESSARTHHKRDHRSSEKFRLTFANSLLDESSSPAQTTLSSSSLPVTLENESAANITEVLGLTGLHYSETFEQSSFAQPDDTTAQAGYTGTAQPDDTTTEASHLGTAQPDATCSGTRSQIQDQAQAHHQRSYFAFEDDVDLGAMAHDSIEFTAYDYEAAAYRLGYNGTN